MNAIILVAGMGTRISKISKTSHKALIEIGGVPNIERNILFLREFGIDDITLVTGHNAHLFDYLKEKCSCRIIFNEKYKEYNNIYSFYRAIDYFGDTVVMDGDVVLLKNIFTKRDTSFYYTVLRENSKSDEWIPVLNENNRVTKIDIGKDKKPSMLGISYWTQQASELIRNEFMFYLNSENLANPKLYWDDIPRRLFDKIFVTTVAIPHSLVSEIDTESDYRNAIEKLKAFR